MGKDAVAASYQEIPYPALPRVETQPAHLAALGTLLGLRPAPPTACRVLELGCSDGGNLLSAACLAPDSEFVGVDLAPDHVAAAEATCGELGLTNVRFLAGDVLELPLDEERFDYVIAHGLYSWVAAPIRARILDLCAAVLAPQGIACVSYKTYPGWHLRELTRGLLRFAGRSASAAPERLARGRELLAFVDAAVSRERSPVYAEMLAHQRRELEHAPDAYVFHDFLEATSAPCYFHEFAAQAASHGLQYVTDARYLLTRPENFLGGSSLARVRRLSADPIELEQHVDLLTNRSFRWSLLCRPEVELTREPGVAQLERLHFASCLTADPGASPSDDGAVSFRGPPGGIRVAAPAAQRAFAALAEAWPRSLPWSQLAGDDPTGVAADALEAHAAGLIDLHAAPLPVVASASERPRASPYARLTAARGGPVLNVRQEVVEAGELGRKLLPHLDGDHDHQALARVAAALAASGAVTLPGPTGAPLQPALAAQAIGQGVTPFLDQLARAGVLLG